MITAERHRHIQRALRRRSFVGTGQLAEQLGVSGETVRRDLLALEEEGALIRVRGGAASIDALAGTEASFPERATLAVEAKRRIGQRAAQLIRPGMTVMIDIGTTALEVARALPADFTGLVVTPSVLVAIELQDRPGVRVQLSGGELRAGDLALQGPTAERFFSELYPDLAFLGSGGVDAVAGLTDYYDGEIATRRIVVHQAKRAYVLVDDTKLGRVAAHFVCRLDQLDGVVTNVAVSPELADAAGGKVIVAP